MKYLCDTRQYSREHPWTQSAWLNLRRTYDIEVYVPNITKRGITWAMVDKID